MEIELKLLLAPADHKAFRQLALLKECTTDRPRTRLLRNIHFDTPELVLKQHGLALRVRRVGRVSIQTLKADGDATAGLHQRQEWETRVAGPQPDLAALVALAGAGSPWHKVLDAPGLAQGLVPIFESEVRRTVWPLRLPDGAEVELVLDKGGLRQGDVHEPISEVELELKAGEPSALFDLALRLQEVVPLRVGNLSKSARGYALLAPWIAAAVKARPVELDRGMSVEQGLRIIVANCLAQVQDNEVAVMRGITPEAIHQMRVGMRRLRSALRLFSRWVSLPQPLLAELAWLGAELGAARDTDVLADSTLTKMSDAWPQEADLLRLKQSASTMAQALRQRAAVAVGSVRYSRLMLGLVGWLHASRWRQPANDSALEALAQPLHDGAARILARLHKKLLDSGKALKKGTPEDRHRVRIAAKKLRYAAEFFRALHSPGRVRRYIKRLTALQDALGWLNDAAVASRLLRDIVQHHPELAVGAAFARGYLGAAAKTDLPGTVKIWRQFSSMGPL